MVCCKKCGVRLGKGANYCPSCGAHVTDVKVEELKVSSDDLVKTVKKLIHEGNVRRIIIKNEKGKMLLEIPVTVGVIGIIIVPWLAALGAIAAMATKCTIIVERRKN